MVVRSLHGAKENVADLQQRLQQYQKKNDEMHEKIATLERKVLCHFLRSLRMNFSSNILASRIQTTM